MKITAQMADMIKKALSTPLREGEMRRVEGLGDLYVSLVPEGEHDTIMYTFLYSAQINKSRYNFYGSVSEG